MAQQYEISRFASRPGLVLVSTAYENHASAPHAYDGATLGFCLDALDEFHCGAFHGPVPAGSLLAIEPGLIHHDRSARGRIRMVYAPEALLGPLLFDAPVLQDPVLWEAGERLFAAPSVEAWDRFAAQWQGRPWVREGRRTSRWDGLLKRLRNEAPNLRTLAAEAGLSPSGFLRRFRAEVGCTPAEYSRQARLARAAESLREGAELAPAAVDHEFFDQSHFTRHFHRVYSVAPGEFRSRNSVQSDED